MKYWEVTWDGRASYPEGVAVLLVASCHGNRDKLRRIGAKIKTNQKSSGLPTKPPKIPEPKINPKKIPCRIFEPKHFQKGLASHPGGNSNNSSRFMLQKPGIAPASWLVCRLTLSIPRSPELFHPSSCAKSRIRGWKMAMDTHCDTRKTLTFKSSNSSAVA